MSVFMVTGQDREIEFFYIPLSNFEIIDEPQGSSIKLTPGQAVDVFIELMRQLDYEVKLVKKESAG